VTAINANKKINGIFEISFSVGLNFTTHTIKSRININRWIVNFGKPPPVSIAIAGEKNINRKTDIFIPLLKSK
jgi:hypothetical protein